MSATTEQELKDAAEYQSVCFKATRELAAEIEQPLIVNEQGMIEQGIFWIPGPFIEPAGGWPKIKKGRTHGKFEKCICPVCTTSHKRKVA